MLNIIIGQSGIGKSHLLALIGDTVVKYDEPLLNVPLAEQERIIKGIEEMAKTHEVYIITHYYDKFKNIPHRLIKLKGKNCYNLKHDKNHEYK